MPAQVTSVEGSARSETEQAPATPVGRRRGAERHQAPRQHPGQDLAYDTVDELVPPSVLLRCGAERSPDQTPHAPGLRASGSPTHGAESMGWQKYKDYK